VDFSERGLALKLNMASLLFLSPADALKSCQNYFWGV